MGCVMSYSLALGPGRPRPAGVIALSGFIPTVEGWQPELAGRERMPVYVHHGRNDPIISVDFARSAVPLLEAGEVDVAYDETDAAHFVPPEAVAGGLRLVDRALG
jgi:phospholipase/carboxylesterase